MGSVKEKGLHPAVREYLDKKRDEKHEEAKKYNRRYMEMLLMEDEVRRDNASKD
jgi:fructose-1,6-bisphosphatase